MHVAVVMGTRPEAIKLAPVIHELGRQNVQTSVISTGQHREMLDQILEEFDVEPDVELSTMNTAQKLSDLTAVVVDGLGRALRRLEPDYVLVQGDTTTALCGALCGFYERVPVGHVEAGLRTGNLASPFPEEANRKAVTAFATDHFCPTAASRANLLREGVAPQAVSVTGNTVIDSLLWAIEQGRHRPATFPTLRPRRILLTLHRRENHGVVMAGICQAITEIVETRDVEVIFPLHKSPAVREVVVPLLHGVDGVILSEPLGYLDLAQTLASCDLVLTDSGGLQEEAPALGKPVLVLRDTTERPEAIEAGVARLIGTSADSIRRETLRLLDDERAYGAMARVANPFGDGHASERIVARIAAALPLAVAYNADTLAARTRLTSAPNEPSPAPDQSNPLTRRAAALPPARPFRSQRFSRK
jgi:UDP-N-acetylglucosamine 2-epimerase (non-hydrolysing)